MSTQRPSLPHLQGHVMAAVDLETTGSVAGKHEIIQMAIVPIDHEFNVLPVRPFYTHMKPEYPERAESIATVTHGLDIPKLVLEAPDRDRVEVQLEEWFDRLDLPHERKLVPLAHNWAFECAFLDQWLGQPMRLHLFHACARDSLVYANCLNDRAALAGEDPPFEYTNLRYLREYFKVSTEHSHDALADCFAEIEIYKRLLTMELF